MPRNRDEYFTISVVSIALFIFFHNFFFFYLLLVVAALPFISFFVSRYVWNRLEVTAEIPLLTIGENNDIPVEFTVNNPTFLPLPGVRIRFTADNRYYPNEEQQEMSLPIRKGVNKYTWNIKSVYSGYVGLHGGQMRAQDFMGLFVFKRLQDQRLPEFKIVDPVLTVIAPDVEGYILHLSHSPSDAAPVPHRSGSPESAPRQKA